MTADHLVATRFGPGRAAGAGAGAVKTRSSKRPAKREAARRRVADADATLGTRGVKDGADGGPSPVAVARARCAEPPRKTAPPRGGRPSAPADPSSAARRAMYAASLRAEDGKKRKPGAAEAAIDSRAASKLRKRLFVRAFVSGPPGVRGVAIRAAEAAGYSISDMGVGADLVRDPDVRALLARYLARWDLKAEDVIDELRRVAFSDVRRYVDWDGDSVTLRPSDELTDDDAAAVAEVSRTATKDGGTVRFRLHDKLAALGLLAKYLGVVADRVEHVGRNGGPIELSTYVYLPRNGRELDPGEVREEPAEVAEFKALPPAEDAAVDPSLARARIALPVSGRNGTP